PGPRTALRRNDGRARPARPFHSQRIHRAGLATGAGRADAALLPLRGLDQGLLHRGTVSAVRPCVSLAVDRRGPREEPARTPAAVVTGFGSRHAAQRPRSRSTRRDAARRRAAARARTSYAT